MKHILTIGLLVATFALFANVDSARAGHRSCYRSRHFSHGHYGSPYYGHSNYGYYPSYNYGPGYGYNHPGYGYHGHSPYYYGGGSSLYLGGRRGGFYIRF